MYDEFSQDYDRFVNWNNRLGFELPFLDAQLQSVGAQRVLDAAAGTGMHAIALAQRGYQAAGADLSRRMVESARRNAAQAGIAVPFAIAGFGELARTFGIPDRQPAFDAVLCLGNSLPHLPNLDELVGALQDFAACLRPGGLLVIQNRNFDLVMQAHLRWMEPQTHQESGREWIFVRFYDFRPDGLIDFNILTWQRENDGPWQQRHSTAALYPQRQAELLGALQQAGFRQAHSFGGLNGAPFDPLSSANLVVTAKLAQAAT